MKIFAVAALVALLAAPAGAETWNIDGDHTNIGFKVKHLMVSNVKGQFRNFRGTVDIDDRDLTKTRISVAVDTASIDTGVKQRDDHLRSADFFDVARHPSMSFASKSVARNGDRLQLVGDLTIRGVTKQVALDVEAITPPTKDPWGGTRRGATAVGKINRKDFGLTWNKALEAGGVVVGEEVQIIIEVEMMKK